MGEVTAATTIILFVCGFVLDIQEQVIYLSHVM